MVQASQGVLIVKTVNFAANFLRFKQEQVCKQEGNNLAARVIYGHFLAELG